MQAIKIFLNPDGQNFVMMGAGENFNMAAWYVAMRKDGAALAPGGLVMLSAIHHVSLEDMAELPAGLTVIPGGKLN